MIKNKLITIKKETCFDKEWALLTPCTGGEYKNRRYRLFAVPEIVRAVTRSQKVFMILSEICLSGAIVRELEWVENDVELHLIAKTQKVADRYSALGFSSVRIDSGVNFNYIHIER